MTNFAKRGLLAAALAGLFLQTAAAVERETHGSLKLFPLVYQRATEDSYDLEALFGLVGAHSRGADYSRRVGPLFWGDDHLHLAPVYWSWGDNWLVPPLAWNLHGHQGVGPVWWGEDYFHAAPLFWSWNDSWLLPPVAGRLFGTTALGPVWWNDRGESGLFPIWWKNPDGWTLLPLGYSHKGEGMLGPVAWDEQHFDVYPFFFSGGGDWLLLPFGGKLDDDYVAGPLWWGTAESGQHT